MNQVDKKLDSDDDDENVPKHLGEETALHYACTAHLRPETLHLSGLTFG